MTIKNDLTTSMKEIELIFFVLGSLLFLYYFHILWDRVHTTQEIIIYQFSTACPQDNIKMIQRNTFNFEWVPTNDYWVVIFAPLNFWQLESPFHRCAFLTPNLFMFTLLIPTKQTPILQHHPISNKKQSMNGLCTTQFRQSLVLFISKWNLFYDFHKVYCFSQCNV